MDSCQLDRHWRIMAGNRHAYKTGSPALLSPWSLRFYSDGGDGDGNDGGDGGDSDGNDGGGG